jgi:hypothetical protein
VHRDRRGEQSDPPPRSAATGRHGVAAAREPRVRARGRGRARVRPRSARDPRGPGTLARVPAIHAARACSQWAFSSARGAGLRRSAASSSVAAQETSVRSDPASVRRRRGARVSPTSAAFALGASRRQRSEGRFALARRLALHANCSTRWSSRRASDRAARGGRARRCCSDRAGRRGSAARRSSARAGARAEPERSAGDRRLITDAARAVELDELILRCLANGCTRDPRAGAIRLRARRAASSGVRSSGGTRASRATRRVEALRAIARHRIAEVSERGAGSARARVSSTVTAEWPR